jgi:hypothetical protein
MNISVNTSIGKACKRIRHVVISNGLQIKTINIATNIETIILE